MNVLDKGMLFGTSLKKSKTIKISLSEIRKQKLGAYFKSLH